MVLMIVGVIGALLSLIAMLVASTRRHRTVVDDGREMSYVKLIPPTD